MKKEKIRKTSGEYSIHIHVFDGRDGSLDGHAIAHVGQEQATHVDVKVATRLAYAHGGLGLVASEHPDLDAGFGERVDCDVHVLLELVLDGRHAHQTQVLLDELVDVR